MPYAPFACLAFASFLLTAPAALAQTTPAASTSTAAPSLKDGVARRNGLTMRLQAGQMSRLSAPVTMDNGLVVRPDGIMISKDGTRQMLPEGKAVNMQGNIVNFTDDMMSAPAIEQRARQVTGQPTETPVPGATRPLVPQRLATELRRTEQRLQLLEQLSDRLAERTKVAVGANPGAAPIDSQLQTIDAQLRR
ncbi:DUF6799 domain-containing protein [Hymenobacter chitinivorans]|uniref:DUF6799 domain-containing protein n=1 Tax=Hymenobacter chitinivorans DSM 11115 TaxID=1121954 RepID=A0A2M9ASV4_9BACT|nr:DUF6799 domain-containing protein [Hymenobacter chitinivorans]PJJ48774.1 hypothetical protein CLV45_4484 [Hymenobacter chitinivorans DSM 11115]